MDNSIIKLFSDPVAWGEAFLRNPDDREKNLVLRSYQSEPLHHSLTSSNIILRYGRRMGKSVTMCVDCLFHAQAYQLLRVARGETKKQLPYKIILVTPYESQIDELWTIFMSLIADSPLLNDQVSKIRTSGNMYLIKFKNGSTIKGYTVGISSSNKGTSLRGKSADLLYIDEMDFIPREIMEEVIIPISTTNTKCKMRVTSTPSGARDMFYDICTRAPANGWLHFHAPSWHKDNTNWTSIEQMREQGKPLHESSEFKVKEITTDSAYQREYGAEFGESFGGVYKHAHINACSVNYGANLNSSNPDLFDPGFKQNSENLYIIGVDWNSYINGGQIVMMEYCRASTIVNYFNHETKKDVTIDFTGKYRLFYRAGIKSKEATQRKTREEIIRLIKHFKIDYVYVDYGAGDTNIEELTLYGKNHKELNMNKKLRVIDSGAVSEHFDPILNEKVKKRNKSLMVNFSALSLEEGMFILPKEEDEKIKLVGQMRGYKIKNVSARGDYVYTGEDHILDAFNLAIFGFQREYGNLLRSNVLYNIRQTESPILSSFKMTTKEANVISTIYDRQQIQFTDPEKRKPMKSPAKRLMPKFGSRTGQFGSPSRRNF